MNEFAIGDRVRRMSDGALATVKGRDAVALKVLFDYGIFALYSHEAVQSSFARIEESQPWQVECFDCKIVLTAETACRYDEFETHIAYLCRGCWEAETADDNRYLVKAQEAALARSRAWMHECHPDDPRWQEAE